MRTDPANPKLTIAQRNRLVAALDKVLDAYNGLKFVREEKVFSDVVSDEKRTLQEVLLGMDLASLETTHKTFGMDGIYITIEVDPDTKKVILNPKESDAGKLIASAQLSIEQDSNGQPVFAAEIPKKAEQDEAVKLGGIGKYDLYNSHLDTLNKIKNAIAAGDDNLPNLLVAQATGSGKTFVQALWFLALYKAELGGVFALPGNLTEQFKSDFKKLLPDDLVDQMVFYSSDSADQFRDKLSKENSKQFFVAPYDVLLDKYYKELKESKLPISFDEEQKVHDVEARSVKLAALSEGHLSMFLSATPSEQAQKNSKTVADMSIKKKAASGQGAIARIKTLKAATMADKLTDKTRKPYANAVYAVDQLHELPASAACTFLEVFPYYYEENKISSATPYQQYRFGSQVPSAKKAMINVDDTDEIVNISRMLGRVSPKEPVDNINGAVERNPALTRYHNGNLQDRTGTFAYFSENGEDIEAVIQLEFQQAQRQALEEKFEQFKPEGANVAPAIEEGDFSTSTLLENGRVYQQQMASPKVQVKRNILQSLVEFLLTDLTGLSSIALDDQRFSNLDALVAKVKDSLGENKAKIDVDPAAYFKGKLLYDADTNSKGIDEEGATRAANILAQIYGGFSSGDNSFLGDLVDNNSLNPALLFRFSNNHKYEGLNKLLDSFVDDYGMLIVMEGKSGAEVPFEDGVVYSGLTEDRYNMYDNGMLSSKAKHRERQAAEQLNFKAEESRFEGKKSAMTPLQAQNYLQLGFCNSYVSNCAYEGFSDPNLHNFVNLVANSDANNNAPEKAVQGFGRLRGLNPHQVPFSFTVHGQDAVPAFDLSHLKNDDDYQVALSQAKKQFSDTVLTGIAVRVSDEINHWVMENLKTDGSVDSKEMQDAVYGFITKALEDINRQNEHNIQLSKKQLVKLLSLVDKHLKNKQAYLKAPQKVSATVKYVGYLLYYAASRDYHHLIKEGRAKVKGLVEAEQNNKAKKTYDAVLEKLPYPRFMRLNAIIKKYMTAFMQVHVGALADVKERVSDFLDAKKKAEIEALIKEKVLPLVRLWIKPEVLDKFSLDETTDLELISIINKHKDFLKDFDISDVESLAGAAEASVAFREKLVALLKDIPGYDAIELEDLQDYVSRAEALRSAMFQATKDNVKAFMIDAIVDQLKSDQFKELIQLVCIGDDAPKVQAIFENADNRCEFAEKIFDLVSEQVEDQAGLQSAMMNQFKQFCVLKDNSLDGFQLLIDKTNDLELFSEELATLAANIKINPEKSLKVDQVLLHSSKNSQGNGANNYEAVSSTITDDLGPAWVKYFNPAAQEKISEAISGCADWPHILYRNQSMLASLSGDGGPDPAQVEAVVCQLLRELEGKGHIEAGFVDTNKRDLQSTVTKNAKQLQSDVKEIVDVSVAKAKKEATKDFFGSMRVWMGSGKKKLEEDIKQKVKEDAAGKLLEYFKSDRSDLLEPFFVAGDYAQIKACLAQDDASGFIDLIVDDLENLNTGKGVSSDQLMQTFITKFNEYFNPKPPIRSLNDVMKTGFDQLGEQCATLAANAKTHIDNHDNPAVYLVDTQKAAVNESVINKLLPFMLKYVKPEHQAAFEEQAENHQDWAEFLYANKALFNMPEDADNAAKSAMLYTLTAKAYQAILGVDGNVADCMVDAYVDANVLGNRFSFVMDRLKSLRLPADVDGVDSLEDRLANLLIDDDYLDRLSILFTEAEFAKLKERLQHNPDVRQNIAKGLATLLRRKDSLADATTGKEIAALIGQFINLNADGEGLVDGDAIKHIGDLAQELKEKANELFADAGELLDIDRVNATLHALYGPFLTSPGFQEAIVKLFGDFDNETLEILLEPKYTDESGILNKEQFDKAKLVFHEFIGFMKAGEFNSILECFMSVEDGLKLDKIKDLMLAFDGVHYVLQALTETYDFFHQYDQANPDAEVQPPAYLKNDVDTGDLEKWVVSTELDTKKQLARKIGVLKLQAMRRSFDELNKVDEKLNSARTQVLNVVEYEIIRPLATSLSHKLRSNVAAFFHGIASLFTGLARMFTFESKSDKQISNSQNMANAYAAKVAGLKPLTEEDVNNTDLGNTVDVLARVSNDVVDDAQTEKADDDSDVFAAGMFALFPVEDVSEAEAEAPTPADVKSADEIVPTVTATDTANSDSESTTIVGNPRVAAMMKDFVNTVDGPSPGLAKPKPSVAEPASTKGKPNAPTTFRSEDDHAVDYLGGVVGSSSSIWSSVGSSHPVKSAVRSASAPTFQTVH